MSDKVNKFKVGDRVKRIANEFPEILIGSEWVVREVLEGSNTIAVEGLPDYWTSANFKLVLENGQDIKTCNPLKTEKFKVGDEVELISLINTDNDHGVVEEMLNVGDRAFVDECDGDTVFLKDDCFSYHIQDFKLIKSVDETNTSQDESIEKGIESDGGSSDYYFTSLPKHMIDQIVETGGIEIKDIIRYVFDNNADAFNIVKAQKRIVESLKGKGKAGITSLYDANKIRFFAEEQYNALNQKES